jgi:hypothetical protein
VTLHVIGIERGDTPVAYRFLDVTIPGALVAQRRLGGEILPAVGLPCRDGVVDRRGRSPHGRFFRNWNREQLLFGHESRQLAIGCARRTLEVSVKVPDSPIAVPTDVHPKLPGVLTSDQSLASRHASSRQANTVVGFSVGFSEENTSRRADLLGFMAFELHFLGALGRNRTCNLLIRRSGRGHVRR